MYQNLHFMRDQINLLILKTCMGIFLAIGMNTTLVNLISQFSIISGN